MSRGFVVGIDATNLRRGGGRTHLIELLRAATPRIHGIHRVNVWGGSETLSRLYARPWLKKINPPELDGNLFRRTLWQRFSLAQAARTAGCDVLLVPGGTYVGDFHPIVTMSRNMLPFEWEELIRYKWTRQFVRLIALRFVQSKTLQRADGIIFLTRYAEKKVLHVSGPVRGKCVVIPHGLNRRFCAEPRPQRAIEEYSLNHPYRILYVSIIDCYKHQWHLVRAVARLRDEMGWPLSLELVGPAYPPALERLKSCLRRLDPHGEWVNYDGAVPYKELHRVYREADLGVFASSCENMPNILLEKMGAGLPLACSDRGPMPEILKDAGFYFDPEDPDRTAEVLKRMICSPKARSKLAVASYTAAQRYTWSACAVDTLQFLKEVAQTHRTKSGETRPD